LICLERDKSILRECRSELNGVSSLDVKKLIVNNDGHGGFFQGRYTSREIIERELEIYVGTYVSIFGWCVTVGSKANYPSKVTEVIGEDVRVFPRRGIEGSPSS